MSDVARDGGACKLFFTHERYEVSVSRSHHLDRPLVSMYIHNSSLHDGPYSCHLSSVDSADISDSSQFTLSVNKTLVLLLPGKSFAMSTEMDEHQFNLFVACTSRDDHQGERARTTVALTVYSVEKAHQVTPCTRVKPEVRRICFAGFSPNVFIRESSVGFVVTEIQGSQLPGCEHFTTTYTAKDDGDPTRRLEVDATGKLKVIQAFSYDTHRKRSRPHVNVTCHVTSTQDVTYESQESLRLNITIVNINNHAPNVFGGTLRLTKTITDIASVKKGKEFDRITAWDEDGIEFTGDIDVFTRGDTQHQFEISTTDFGRARIAILKWARSLVIPGDKYNFQVVFRDRGYIENVVQNGSSEVVYDVNVVITLPWFVKNTARQYSRVAGRLPRGSNWTVVRLVRAPDSMFAITPREGILYINDTAHMVTAAGSVVTLQLRYNNRSQDLVDMSQNVTILESSNMTVQGGKCDTMCPSYHTEKSCTTQCGGGVCSWLNSCLQQNHDIKNPIVVQEVCACSADPMTCPDGVCDELEELHPNLCPLDCRKGVVAVKRYKNRTGNLVNAHCWCDMDGCQCRTEKDASDVLISKAKRMQKTSGSASCDLVCIIVVVGSIAAAGLMLFIIVLFVSASRSGRLRHSEANPEKPLNGSVVSLSATPSDYVDAGDQLQPRQMSSAISQNSLDWLTRGMAPPLSIDKKWEFPRLNIKLEKTLGEGEFGRVVRAQAYQLGHSEGYTTVAVKMLKECATGSEFRDLLSEYNLLKDVSHTNVIKLLGVCSKGGPFYLIVEYCEHGALRSFLRECRLTESPETDQRPPIVSQQLPETDSVTSGSENCVSANDLLSFTWQIAKGMQYLSTMKLVHRDLAARNVLVAAGKVIKISDFGLSRDIYEEDTYMKRSKGRIPVKWMAPESLYEQVYTTKSDVWSFGITLWEIVTLGATPYPGLAPERLYHQLKSGYRMEKPTHCSDQLFRVMSWSWRTLPGDRPTFAQLVTTIEGMLQQNVEYLDLGEVAERNPIFDDETMENEDAETQHEEGYGSISRLTEDNAYLNPASHGQNEFDNVICCDDCTMRMIKEGDVTTECTKLLGENNDSVNNNNSSNNKVNARPLVYIQVEHDQSDEESEHSTTHVMEVI